MSTELIELTGKVVRETFGKGSKSEHAAVYLDTGKEKYTLKKFQGPSFGDKSFDPFVGKKVRAKGFIRAYVFVVKGRVEIL